MIISEKLTSYNKNNIFILDPMNNNVISNGIFYRILYSSNYFVMNGLYIEIPLIQYNILNYYNKYLCEFNTYNSTNINIIEQITNIENNILDKLPTNKYRVKRIVEQLNSGKFKIMEMNNNSVLKQTNNQRIILKISGIWENESTYGITYKFMLL